MKLVIGFRPLSSHAYSELFMKATSLLTIVLSVSLGCSDESGKVADSTKSSNAEPAVVLPVRDEDETVQELEHPSRSDVPIVQSVFDEAIKPYNFTEDEKDALKASFKQNMELEQLSRERLKRESTALDIQLQEESAALPEKMLEIKRLKGFAESPIPLVNRTWKTGDNRFSVVAELQRDNGFLVTLKLEDGRSVEVTTAILDEDSNNYLAEIAQERKNRDDSERRARRLLTDYNEVVERIMSRRKELESSGGEGQTKLQIARQVISDGLGKLLKPQGDDPQHYVAEVPEGYFHLFIATPEIYIAEGNLSLFSDRFFLYFISDQPTVPESGSDERIYPNDGFFDLGKPVPIVHSSRTKNILIEEKETTGYWYEFIETGTGIIQFQYGETKVFIRMSVTEFPYPTGTSIKTVIAREGFPSEKKYVNVRWPRSGGDDMISYSPSAGEGSISATHYKFKEYPHGVFSFVGNSFYRIGYDLGPAG